MALLPKTLSIQTRLIAGIALAASTLMVLIGWYWTVREEHELTAALERRAERMSQLVARGFAGPIWNLDTTAMGNLLEAVRADPEVHEIELVPQGAESEALRWRRDRPAVQPLERRFDILHQAAPSSRPAVVGQARLVFSRERVNTSLANTRRLVASLLAAVLAAVVVTSYWLVHRLVARPVAQLGALARRVAGGELGATLAVQRADEIGILVRQFNSMSEQLRLSSEHLRRSEERYRSLFENATEGIFQADGRGRLLGLNKALAQLLGYARPEQALAAATSLRRLIRIEPGEFKRIAHALERHRVLQQVPLLVGTHDGRELWLELSIHIVLDAGGRGPLRIEGMISDITQRRLAEQELTQHRDHLEELVAERTLELSQAKLRAEDANRSKSRFLATMSHEFRTPLNAILGFAQLLQMDASLNAAQQGKIKLMRDSGEHLLSLISDLLDMASIEAGKVKLMPAVADLRALLEMACDSLRPRAEEKGLRFVVALDKELPTRVRVDGQRLRQVVLNLLSNAIKFTDSGQVCLRARLLPPSSPGLVRLCLEVEDSGIGMTAEQSARLFRPFEQVSELSRRDGGTGLGLSISQQLMRLMDSRIEVRSAPGQGSCFSFELELALQS